MITFCLSFVVKMVNYNVLNIRSNFKRKQICIHSARSWARQLFYIKLPEYIITQPVFTPWIKVMLHKLKLLNTIEVPLERVEILHTMVGCVEGWKYYIPCGIYCLKKAKILHTMGRTFRKGQDTTYHDGTFRKALEYSPK